MQTLKSSTRQSQIAAARQLIEFCISTKCNLREHTLPSKLENTLYGCFAHLTTFLNNEASECIDIALIGKNQSMKVFVYTLPDRAFIVNINHHCDVLKIRHNRHCQSQIRQKNKENIFFRFGNDVQINIIFKLLMFGNHTGFSDLNALTFYGTFEEWAFFPLPIYTKNCAIVPTCTSISVLVILETINQKHWSKNMFIFEQLFLICATNMVTYARTEQSLGLAVRCLNSFKCDIAALLYFCSDQISHVLQTNSKQRLKAKIQKIIDNDKTRHKSEGTSANAVCQLLKQWRTNLKSHGLYYLKGLQQKFWELQNQITPRSDAIIPRHSYFIFAKWFAETKQLEMAQTFYIAAIIAADNYYQRITSLIYLSGFCVYFKQYLLARKILKYAYNLCRIGESEDLIMFPSFVRKKYRKRNKYIRNKTKILCCAYCKKANGLKLKACIGCMTAIYCSKSHQKHHWKQHKTECSGWWRSNYNKLKSVVS